MSLNAKEQKELDESLEKLRERREQRLSSLEAIKDACAELADLGVSAMKILGRESFGRQICKEAGTIARNLETLIETIRQDDNEHFEDCQKNSKAIFDSVMAGMELQKREGNKKKQVCSVCGKSFRGHEPLDDGNGNLLHKKCAPQMDVEKTREKVAEVLTPKEETFTCPWCGEEKPVSCRCSKGYCRTCSSYDT